MLCRWLLGSVSAMSHLLFEVVRVRRGFVCAQMYASSNVDVILHVGVKVAVIVLSCELDHCLALGFTWSIWQQIGVRAKAVHRGLYMCCA